MELKKMIVTPILVNGEPLAAYSIQTANEAYKLEKSFGDYAKLGFFTIVAKDGMSARHFLPKNKFEEEILRFDPEVLTKGKRGRPATEDRFIAIDQKLNKILDILCSSASLR